MARDFDQSNDYIVIGDHDGLDLPWPFTICAWIAPDDAGQQSNGRIIDKGGGNLSSGWTFLTDGSQQLVLYVNGGSGGNALGSGSGDVNYGVWQHVAVAYGTDGSAHFYTDGTDAGTDTGGSSPTANTQAVWIGARANDSNREFDGKMAHIQLFDVELTQAEIATLMYRPGAIPRGLVAWWPIVGSSTEPDWGGGGYNSTSISGTTVADGPPCGPWTGLDIPHSYVPGEAPPVTRRIFIT
jgi:hypothetical protein